MASDDLDRIMLVMEAAFDPAFGEAWTRRQVEDALMIGNCHYELAMAGADCAGFYLARNGYGEVELLLLAVVPHHRRCGHASGLLRQFETLSRQLQAERLLLEMRRGNPAEALYRRFGFEEVGLRPNYYRLPGGSRADAITFSKTIAATN